LPAPDLTCVNPARRLTPKIAFMFLRPLPVLVACQGCPEFGQAALDVALLLDRRGYGESAWLGATRQLATIRTKVGNRFPVVCIDACARGCAQRWLAEAGVEPDHRFVLTEAERTQLDAAALRIAAAR
jgi:uncharacterized metal-binding protein